MQVAKKPGPPGAREWGHGRLSGRSGRWALAGWGWRGRDGWVPGLRAGQAAGSLLPGELSDLLSPPPLPGCWGGGRGGLSLLPPSNHLFSRRSGSAQRRARKEVVDLRRSPPGKERRRWGPRHIRRGRHREPRVLDPGVRSLGRCCLTGGSGPKCGAPGRRARLVLRGWRRGLLETIRETGEAADGVQV